MKIFSLFFLIILFLSGTSCQRVLPVEDGYTSLSQINKFSKARNKTAIRELDGRIIKIWGYLDPHNIALEKGSIKNQPADWDISSFDGLAYFDIKPYATRDSVNSIRIKLGKETKQYKRLFEQLSDVKEQPRKVFITGRLQLFMAPTNFRTMVAVSIKVSSPDDILLGNTINK